MKCFICIADNPNTGRFCTQCGAALGIQCPRCGVISPWDSKFCGACGASLTEDAPQQALSEFASNIPTSTFSAGLPNHFNAGSERRHLTVLFCDMVGSTALAKLLDPEELHDITRTYYDRCNDAIHRFEGVIANYIGDGVMALFGYPRAHEDDAERAVHSALSIMRAVANIETKNNGRLQVRVGIATGLVVVGEDGRHALTKEKTVIGEAPNLAAHLQAVAEPNRVLISETTRQLVGEVFMLEQLEINGLKGAKEGAAAWRVLGEKVITSRFAAHAGTLTNFVGRNQEVALLRDRWQRACQGEGQVVLLVGEAGIGKSRIVEAFRKLICEEAQTATCYQCSPYHTDSPLYPVICQLENAANLKLDDPPSVRLGKLETLLQVGTNKIAEVVPLIAALLSIPTGDRYAPPDVDAQRRKERTLDALVDQLAGLASQQPLLMIVEDAHWADPTTFDLFNRAMLRLPDLRVLLVITYRPEFTPAWIGDHITPLLLNRLGRRYCRTMIDSIAHSKSLPPAVMEQIIGKTDGVPLFVEELTKTVLESGLLREADDAWLLAGPIEELAIPSTLQASLLARLDRLASVKEVAQIGAAIGREFSYKLLAAVSPLPEIDLQNALNKLAATELIFAHGVPPAAKYTFKHALVQDAAYETLLKSRRQQLHGYIAVALEERFHEMTAAQPELLAHHYTQAGLTEPAVKWWDKAGDQAIKRSANMEAVHHFNRAIELLRLGPETPEQEARELDVRVKLSGPLIATRGYVTSQLAENYTRAWQLCNKLGEEKSAYPVMYGQWVIPYVRGDMAAALKNSEKFLRRAELQDDVGLLMMGHRIYGSSLVWSGDTLQGSEHLRRALSLYRGPEHDRLAYIFSQHPRTAALAHLCLALQHLGHLDQAMEAGWQAISEAKRIMHFNSIAYSLCFVSLLIMLRRDIITLKKTAGELLQLAKQHNASYWALWARPMLGWIAAQEGNIEAGVRQMHKSTEELQKQNANLWVPQTLLLEAEILGNAGQYQRAYRLLDAAQALIEPLDQRFYEAELHRVRGSVLLSESPLSGAGVASLDRGIDVARRQNSRFLELRACVSKARHWRDHGLRDEARDILMPVYRSLSEGLMTVDVQEARALLDDLGSGSAAVRRDAAGFPARAV